MSATDLIIPLVSPMTDDTSSVSEIRMARTVRWHRENGAAGFVVGSAAGEPFALSLKERKSLVEWTMRDAANLPVYVNVTGFATASIIDLCIDASDWGVAGVVLLPPQVTGITHDEMKDLLSAVRRHGKVGCGFLDVTGKWQDIERESAAPGIAVPHLLKDKGMEQFASARITSSEFWTVNGMAHPIGVFGAPVAKKLIENWDAYKDTVNAILDYGGIPRVGKYVLERFGVDVGPPRGPLNPLNQKGRELVEHLLVGLGFPRVD
ncbi:MAG: dihydrodipicolinate synthase family protein [Armatimonadetes bacterium]|nr:dihydrodipicolinate synthase family protein [Armatimonadota bacterium]